MIHLLNDWELHLGINFDYSFSFTTWRRHVCGHQHSYEYLFYIEKFLKLSKMEARTSFLASFIARVQRGSTSCTACPFMRSDIEVCSLGLAIVQVLISHVQHQWSPVVWHAVPSCANSGLFTFEAPGYGVSIVPSCMAPRSNSTDFLKICNLGSTLP